jgi:hypothetical protein
VIFASRTEAPGARRGIIAAYADPGTDLGPTDREDADA